MCYCKYKNIADESFNNFDDLFSFFKNIRYI